MGSGTAPKSRLISGGEGSSRSRNCQAPATLLSCTGLFKHLAHEKFNLYTGVKSTYVPFKGTGELVTAVMGKHITGAMSYVPAAMQQKSRMRMSLVK